MKLSISTICDRATVREGLLHILGAGVTTVTQNLPSPLMLDVAILLTIEAEDVGEHWLSVVLRHEDTDDRLGEIRAQFEVPEDQVRKVDAPLGNVPVSIPLRTFRITKEGFYVVDVIVDNNLMGALRIVVHAPEQPESEQNGSVQDVV
ncbi:DUF6941 family protein [Phytohabitans rumicis]|uniref:Uncharacterized protein n=1 Tax=Phytohabitans rumicis TaxID=1076125 RepID=A0A6V8KZD0_9ACTN|nr:hypothetical protein [Phytohabitans rumicis]GFJ87841.1 hypothetical protein Prum_014830 [Phytohabitans rumicis]